MEKFDRNSPEYWEKKLVEAGMPENLPLEVALPTPESEKNEQELQMFSEAMSNLLEHYSDLPPKIQRDIYADVIAKHEEGLPFLAIAKRVRMLVEKGKELVGMGSEASDKNYRPRSSAEELKLNGETEKLLKELERRRKEKEKEDTEEEKSPEKENPPDTPEPPKKDWVN